MPDGRRGALFGLKLTNPGAAPHGDREGRRPLRADGRSTRGASTASTPNASDNLPDTAPSTAARCVFTDDGALPGGARRTTTRRSSAPTATPIGGRRPATGFRGPQPGHRCTAGAGRAADAERVRRRPVRPRHRRRAPLPRRRCPADGRRRSGSRVAGSDQGLAPARSELAAALQRPGRRAAPPRSPPAATLARQTQLVAAGRPAAAARASTGASRTSPTSRRRADDLQIRWTNQGKQFPRAAGHRAERARWFGAGFPDYPWMFATDGEYTAFAAVALGQFERDRGPPARAARRLRHRSTTLGRGRARDRSPTARSASGTTRRRQPDGTTRTTSTPTRRSSSRAPSRWSGAGPATTASATTCTTSRSATCTTSHATLDADGDGWPEGSGNVERAGHGPGEARQRRLLHPRAATTSPTWRAVQARRRPRVAWATRSGRQAARRASRRRGGTAAAQQYADSLDDPGNAQSSRSTGSAQTPMEAELDARRPGRARPRAARPRQRPRSPGARTSATAATAPVQPRPVPHRLRRRPGRQGRAATIFSLTTVDPGGRRGQLRAPRPRPAARYTDANAETMFSEPATGGTPDEQPGAMPEIFPSPDFDHRAPAEHRPLLDLPLDVHAGVGQLRHRVAGRPPAARRAARPRPRRGSRSSRRCPTARRASRAPTIRLGRRASSPSRRRTAAPPTRRACRSARRSPSSRSGTRCPRGRRWRRRRSTAGRSRPTRARRTAAWRSRSTPARARTRWW